MRVIWPSIRRANNQHSGEVNCSSVGEARPDFFCIGAQKGGTTWLYQQLAAHPDFWMPPLKELHYFDQLGRTGAVSPKPRDDRDVLFLERTNNLAARLYLDLDDYGRLFEAKGALLSGDITPAYSMLNDEIIERVVTSFPNAKVIFIARDPVERAWSSFSMAARLGMIAPFNVTDVDEVLRNLLHPGVLLRSYPSKIVGRWKRYVRPDLFRIFFFDDLEKNPGQLRRSILQFLAADPDKPSGRLRPDHNSDARRKKLRMTDKVRCRMAQFFKDELKACAVELAGPAREWPARYGFSICCLFAELFDTFDFLCSFDWAV
jgi:hypothetical protein